MVLRSKREVTDSELEKLAVSICEDFLKEKKRQKTEKTIFLKNAKPEILLKLKQYIDDYLATKGESVRVDTPSTVYSVDVAYFFR